jgi:Nucleotidyl transferase AbiEii toxin, Type IV TA system
MSHEPTLPEKILAVHERLLEAKVGHAFGGALALAYYAEPRATDDIDLNVFLAPPAFPVVEQALAPLGIHGEVELASVERDGQCRLHWGRTPIDLFFSYDELHEAMRRDARLQPFGETRIPTLAPEHLLICKAIFDRPKDWLDIEQILVCVADLDLAAIRTWLNRTVGAEDPRRERFDQTVRAVEGGGSAPQGRIGTRAK